MLLDVKPRDVNYRIAYLEILQISPLYKDLLKKIFSNGDNKTFHRKKALNLRNKMFSNFNDTLLEEEEEILKISFESSIQNFANEVLIIKENLSDFIEKIKDTQTQKLLEELRQKLPSVNWVTGSKIEEEQKDKLPTRLLNTIKKPLKIVAKLLEKLRQKLPNNKKMNSDSANFEREEINIKIEKVLGKNFGILFYFIPFGKMYNTLDKLNLGGQLILKKAL